jgi:predicted solute-binding protein
MEWKHFTGLPFVFAVWGILKKSHLNTNIFKKAKEYGTSKIDTIANSYAIENKLTSFGRKLAYKYLTENLSYNLGKREQKSLMLFYNLAKELKLITYTNKVNFTK